MSQKRPADPGPGAVLIPGDRLKALALRVTLSRAEWRLLALVLASPTPLTARQLAKRLQVSYEPVKRTVRGLVHWQILERTAQGLAFQPDADRLGPP